MAPESDTVESTSLLRTICKRSCCTMRVNILAVIINQNKNKSDLLSINLIKQTNKQTQ